jgi:hypothetical protein
MKRSSELRKLIFKLENLLDLNSNNTSKNFVLNEEEMLEHLDFLSWEILHSDTHNIDTKIINKCRVLLNPNESDLQCVNSNNIILVANLILKLNLENQKLS